MSSRCPLKLGKTTFKQYLNYWFSLKIILHKKLLNDSVKKLFKLTFSRVLLGWKGAPLWHFYIFLSWATQCPLGHLVVTDWVEWCTPVVFNCKPHILSATEESKVSFRENKLLPIPWPSLVGSHIFLVLRDHGVYMYVVYIWKWSSAHALGGVSGVASFITTDEQLQ